MNLLLRELQNSTLSYLLEVDKYLDSNIHAQLPSLLSLVMLKCKVFVYNGLNIDLLCMCPQRLSLQHFHLHHLNLEELFLILLHIDFYIHHCLDVQGSVGTVLNDQSLVILLILEDILPIVATQHHMIDARTALFSCKSCHSILTMWMQKYIILLHLQNNQLKNDHLEPSPLILE